MSEAVFFQGFLFGWFALAVVIFASLFFVNAPYGRHTRKGWGFGINPKWGWFFMEFPALSLPLFFFFFSLRNHNFVAVIFLSLWEIHYVQRTLIYPAIKKKSPYKMPRGGLFKYVSSPNYLGEILEWTGWALATWALPGAAFALWTMANLTPRALANHSWYLKNFPDYPKKRKAIIPFIL